WTPRPGDRPDAGARAPGAHLADVTWSPLPRRPAFRASAIIPPVFLIGIDVGGTFTDLTAIDETTGRVVVTKVPSRRQQEAGAVLAGLEALSIASADVRRVVHGTTVGTN